MQFGCFELLVYHLIDKHISQFCLIELFAESYCSTIGKNTSLPLLNID